MTRETSVSPGGTSGGWAGSSPVSPSDNFRQSCFFVLVSTLHYYLPQTKLREGNVFTGVCPQGGWTLTATRGGYVGGRYSPPTRIHGTWDSTGYGLQASSTHPTGMLSRFKIVDNTRVKNRIISGLTKWTDVLQNF